MKAKLGDVVVEGDALPLHLRLWQCHRVFRYLSRVDQLLTAKVISIDPIANGKHTGRSQLIEVALQHLCEKTAHA